MPTTQSLRPASTTPAKRSRGRPRLSEAASIEKVLLDIALQEFLQQGYGGASVSKIVRQAGISKTTMYSRFASKEDLFHAIIESQIEKLSPAGFLSSTTGPLTLKVGLTNYASHMLELNLKGDLLGVNRLMYSESHRFPELGREAARRSRLGIKRIADFIRQCTADEKTSCKDPEGVAEVFILSVRGWYIDAILTNRKVTAKQRKDWVDRFIHVLMSSSDHW